VHSGTAHEHWHYTTEGTKHIGLCLPQHCLAVVMAAQAKTEIERKQLQHKSEALLAMWWRGSLQ
jgi:hypothetical protein